MSSTRTPPRKIRIGTAGWSVPRPHAHLFGAGDSLLARYATRFSAVEINTSFYRPHQRKTYERWAASVPPGFRFSVKMPQAISHELGLRGAIAPLDRFLDEVAGLGDKLGGLLLQLPPGLAYDGRVASAFLRALRRRSDVPVACEPRHSSWFAPAAEQMLQVHRIARVAADPARVPAAALPGGDTRWRYWRWHGAPRIYYSEYGQSALTALAAQVRALQAGAAPWVIFDNTAHGFAASDAARLQDLLRPATTGASAAQPKQRRR